MTMAGPRQISRDLGPGSMALLALSLSPLAAAAGNTTVRMIQPIGADVPGIYASVIAAAPTATTYGMACGPDFPAAGVQGYPKAAICPSIAALTITQGPETLAFTTPTRVGAGPTLLAGLACKLGTDAVCTKSLEGQGQEVITVTGGVPLGDVVVTAGVEKLGPAAASAAPKGAIGATPTGDQKAGGAAAPKSTGTSQGAAAPTGIAQLFSGLAVAAGVAGLVAL